MKVANVYTNQMSAFAAEYCGENFDDCVKFFKACAGVIKNHSSKIKRLTGILIFIKYDYLFLEFIKIQDSSIDNNDVIINDNLTSPGKNEYVLV